MKYIYLILFLLLLCGLSFSQSIGLRYGRCNNCNGTGDSFNFHDYTVSNIASDYGMRVWIPK